MNIYFRSKTGYNVIRIWPQNSSPAECHINVSHDRRAEYVMCYRIVLRALDCVLIGLLSAPLWDYICTQINGNAKWIFGFLRILEASTSQHWNRIIRIMAERQGGRSWQPFVEGKIAHKNFRQARICYFHDRCAILARNCKFANLIQYNMQYVPCNSALFTQETLFDQKEHFFDQSVPKSA